MRLALGSSESKLIAVKQMRRLCLSIIATTLFVADSAYAADAPEIVSFKSGDKTLHGYLYRLDGKGPFPAVLYNHGSSAGLVNNAAFEAIAPRFMEKGWVFFAPYRRGQGLSEDAGRYILDQINEAGKQSPSSRDAMAIRLLSGEQLQDQLAAARWLESQPIIDRKRVAVMGNSFGGIETVYGAEHHSYCAAVNLAGAAISWDEAPLLRTRLTEAVRHIQSPMLFIQAENDFSTEPSKVLYAAALKAHRTAQIRIFPPFAGGGEGGMQGHSFAWLGASEWFPEAFEFIAAHCQKRTW